jgi:hypothetical protein
MHTLCTIHYTLILYTIHHVLHTLRLYLQVLAREEVVIIPRADENEVGVEVLLYSIDGKHLRRKREGTRIIIGTRGVAQES